MPELAIDRTRTCDTKQLATDRTTVRLPQCVFLRPTPEHTLETIERLGTFRDPPRLRISDFLELPTRRNGALFIQFKKKKHKGKDLDEEGILPLLIKRPMRTG